MEDVRTYSPKVHLFIYCRTLTRDENLKTICPSVEVFVMGKQSNMWARKGQTEVLQGTTNPDFIKCFEMDYHFEEQLFLKLKVWNVTDQAGSLKNAGFIGEAECTMGEIVGSSGQLLLKTLRLPESADSRGKIMLRTEEMELYRKQVHFHIKGSRIHRPSNMFKGLFRNFKPYFYLTRPTRDNATQRVHKSSEVFGRNPLWKPFELSLADLTGNNLAVNEMDTPLSIEVYDHHKQREDQYIGTGTFTLRSIIEEGSKEIHIARTQYSRKTRGTIRFLEVAIKNVPTFIDYITGGCQLNLLVAIDFTVSNKKPEDPSSLHSISAKGGNDYEKALHSVGEILLDYDSDKMVPMYGFGGKFYGEVHHCFNMNFDLHNPHVCGLNGMMQVYHESLSKVEFSGPTLFAPVIRTAVDEAFSAAVTQEKQQYFILLILTDGVINDMEETVDLIVSAAKAPISIVIVGIGNEDFTKMHKLDADDVPLVSSQGEIMSRDIVQFVPFRVVGNSPHALAREVLDEIPREIVNFFNKAGIVPGPVDVGCHLGPQSPSVPPASTNGAFIPPPPPQPRGTVPSSQLASEVPRRRMVTVPPPSSST